MFEFDVNGAFIAPSNVWHCIVAAGSNTSKATHATSAVHLAAHAATEIGGLVLLVLGVGFDQYPPTWFL